MKYILNINIDLIHNMVEVCLISDSPFAIMDGVKYS